MSKKNRFYNLTRLHRQLDEALRRELRGRGGDPLRILRLRGLMAAVKGRIATLMRQPTLAH